MSLEPTVDDLLALDMEYKLTVAHRIHCDCARYFILRRDVLMPIVLNEAVAKGEDVADYFAAFARRVHARHEDGHKLDVSS